MTMGIKHNSNVIAGSLLMGAAVLVAAGIFAYILAINELVGANFMWRSTLITVSVCNNNK